MPDDHEVIVSNEHRFVCCAICGAGIAHNGSRWVHYVPPITFSSHA